MIELLVPVLVFIKWWLTLGLPGLAVVCYRHIKIEGYVTVDHIVMMLLSSLLGPFITGGVLFFMLHMVVTKSWQGLKDLLKNYGNVVLWRSKSNKTKQVLFKDEDDD